MTLFAGADELAQKLEQLFSERGDVAVRETTKSWLFLTSDRVFKLKKPVHDSFQDLSSLRARHDNTLNEIDLNRRIAPDLYLGAVRVGRRRDGQVVLDDKSAETVDWLVHMRRLPADQILKDRIIDGDGEAELGPSIDKVADKLCAFYAQAPKSWLTPFEILTLREDQLGIARNVLMDPKFSVLRRRVDRVLRAINGLIETYAQRAEAGFAEHILECHGDLRPEHVCLTEPPVIFDCLEFSRPLRLADPFSEVVFLGMECDMLGAGWIKPRLIAALETGLGMSANAERLRFYEAWHAVVRARLCFAHLLVPRPRTPEKWAPIGERYLVRAEELVV
ncbi:MAG: hypothetical protein KJO30_11020 [Boseongicola sp.]|nr:hypothetical protein [Boseongicola sp.]